MVREGATGRIVGSTRLLTDAQSDKAGGFYSHGEFDLTPCSPSPAGVSKLAAPASACGEPCFDPAFNRADFLVLVNVRDIDASYTRHFLDRAIQN